MKYDSNLVFYKFQNMASDSSYGTLPIGLKRHFACVRPLIFQFPDIPFPSVPGTGFLITMWGELFFITTHHALKNNQLEIENLVVLYNRSSNKAIPFTEAHTYRSAEPDDTDQVDIIILKADRIRVDHDLLLEKPFDISARQIVPFYSQGMRLFFNGIAPEKNQFDYDAGKFDLHYASASAIYLGPTICRSVHTAKADVNRDCPDFNGMSGSPLFLVANEHDPDTPAWFAGMLIQGVRSTSTMRFMEAERIAAYLTGFFIGKMTIEDGTKELERIVKRHFKIK